MAHMETRGYRDEPGVGFTCCLLDRNGDMEKNI